MGLREQVKAFLDKRPFPIPTTHLVLGVSGGADSLALLHVLSEGKIYPRERLTAVYVRHGLRAADRREAAFVRQICAQWGVSHHVEKANVPNLVHAMKWSVEEAARKARYRLLSKVAAQVGTHVVMVAHHADDQAETVLMHFLRGSGLAGLRGMAPFGPMPETEADIFLARPLLGVWREEIEAYCGAHGLTPLQDESNRDTTLFRNRLRHELLPLLSQYNPQIKERLVHSATVIAADEALLEEISEQAWQKLLLAQGDGWLHFDLTQWQSLALSLRRRLLRKVAQTLHGGLQEATFKPVEQARHILEAGQTGARATLWGGITLEVGYDTVTAWVGTRPTVDLDLPLRRQFPQLKSDRRVRVPVPGRLDLAEGWYLETQVLDTFDVDQIEANRDRWQAFIAVPAETPLYLRPRQAGERFWPLGMRGHSAKVKEIMINSKIPASVRGRWPLVADEAGVLWLPGYRPAARAAVAPDSRRVLRLRIKKEKERMEKA